MKVKLMLLFICYIIHYVSLKLPMIIIQISICKFKVYDVQNKWIRINSIKKYIFIVFKKSGLDLLY